jgi:cytochrome P450
VYIPVSTYQLDESQWPRAAEFLPERHMPGREDLGPAAAKSNAFAPFGHGAR